MRSVNCCEKLKVKKIEESKKVKSDDVNKRRQIR